MKRWLGTAAAIVLASSVGFAKQPLESELEQPGSAVISSGEEVPGGELLSELEETTTPDSPDEEFVEGNITHNNVVWAPRASKPLSVCVPQLRPGFNFDGGVLFLQPSSDNLGWGVLTNEFNYASPVPIASPYWEVETLRPGYELGFEVGAGYSFAGTGNDVQVNWQHLRTGTSDAAAVSDPSAQWFSPFLETGPPTASDYEDMYELSGVNLLNSGTASVNFAYDAVDLDIGQYLTIGPSLLVRLFTGVSYARMQERILSNFYGAKPPEGTPYPLNVQRRISFDNTSTFNGVGPRLGFDTTYQLRKRLRFSGQLAGALLVGNTAPAQFLFSASTPELTNLGIDVNREYIGSDTKTHVVYAATARLGLGWCRPLRNGSTLSFDGGYMASFYADPFAGYETGHNIIALQIGSLSTGSVDQSTSSFSLHGFFLNAGIQW